MCNPPQSNQPGYNRLILTAPVGRSGTGAPNPEKDLFAQLGPDTVMMMGDNPVLPKMPDKPTLLDFFKYRFVNEEITRTHLLTSAKRAMEDGQPDKVVIACLLHDFANGGLIRSDHGYWGAQMMRPYVDEEIAWAIEKHQALRYFADEQAGYDYPESYNRFFGPDYVPPEYIRQEAEAARNHRWYMTGRLVTKYDIYFFDQNEVIDPEIFTDIIGRNFKQPEEGLGFDGSPSAHMWRTFIWPNNFL
ncbi:MAG: hypothetical protein IBJ12_02535 [Sphingomonadaceae bacterium]|nr:hypothetical protein [Sphingomonadaceae bacterium]